MDTVKSLFFPRPNLLWNVVAINALLFAVIVFVMTGTSEGAATLQGLSAEQYLKRVAQSNPRLQISESEVEAAAARMKSAGLWDNPTIAYEREEVNDSGGSIPETYLTLELPLEISGRRAFRVDSAERGVQAAQADVEATRLTLLVDAMRVYLRAAAWRERLQIIQAARDDLARLRDSIKSRADAGDASGYDLTRIEVELSSLEDRVADAQRETAKARLKMGMFLGRLGEPFEATDPLTTKHLAGPKVPENNARSHPQLMAARQRVAQYSLEREAAARGWVPYLTLSGGLKTSSFEGDTASGYVAGIALTIPIFDFGQGEKAEANASLRRARAREAHIALQAGTNIAVAQETFESALKQVRRFERDQLPRLQKLMGTAEIAYREGERPIFELLDAYRMARETRIRYVILKLNARLSEIDLMAALGRAPGENQ